MGITMESLFKCSAVALVFVLLAGCAQRPATGAADADAPDTGRILASHFGSELEHKSVDGATVLSYCPDNTCEEFSISQDGDIRYLNDFAYLMFAFTHMYNYRTTKEFRNDRPRGEADKVLQRNAAGCAAGKDFVRCVILGLYRRNDISWTFVRYDEGSRNAGKVDINEGLRIRLIE